MLKSESIKNLLNAWTLPDLAALYSIDMECQVVVAQDGGTRVDSEFKGKKSHGYTDKDGLEVWKPFRIPFNAATDPTYEDSHITFDLAKHAEGIGMTGWNWKERRSKWVAFDFDAIMGHSTRHTRKMNDDDLTNILKAVEGIPWVTVRRSTSGKGLHFYVFLDHPTANHNEHAALARAILGKMSAIAGFDFSAKVDTCGGNMWVWHRKQKGTNGLSLVKAGIPLTEIPENWKEHTKVITGHRRKAMPREISESAIPEIDKLFEELTGQSTRTPLDADHKRLIDYLEMNNCAWWWDADHHILVTHTIHLKEAFDALELRGVFKTNAKGTERGVDHNCFAHPTRGGGWRVRRFTPGVEEDATWTQDGQGWTCCNLNREPDIGTAARCFEGLEIPSGGFSFRHAEQASDAARMLGIEIKIPTWAATKETKIKEHKDGRLIVELDKSDQDKAEEMRGWLADKGKWKKIFNVPNNGPQEVEVGNYDDIVRHLVTQSGEDYGWRIKSNVEWQSEPITHVKVALKSLGHGASEVDAILGNSIFKCWTVVNYPFQPEYPGDRQWNLKSPQLRYVPKASEELAYPSWQKILHHCGKSLDESVKLDGWCKTNNILTGADYLKIWIASLFQQPTEPLPYLFFWGNQNCGKSIFHEALELLITSGYVRAESALVNPNGFNAELAHSILAIVEEIDLRKNKVAYNRIKDWVTARLLPIHEKGSTPYSIPNTTHWIQCANDLEFCPIFPGDTRITICHVEDLSLAEKTPKRKLIEDLKKEAPDFLAEILRVELPEPNDRLNIPVIATQDKMDAENANMTDIDLFLKEKTYYIPGHSIHYSELYDKFVEWLDPNQQYKWTKIRFGRELPRKHPKGRSTKDSQFIVGNISWVPPNPEHKIRKRLVLQGETLIEDEKDDCRATEATATV
jgi:hypothetical protein